MKANLEVARAAWQIITAAIRHAPITDARRFVDKLRAELDALFPPQRGGR